MSSYESCLLALELLVGDCQEKSQDSILAELLPIVSEFQTIRSKESEEDQISVVEGVVESLQHLFHSHNLQKWSSKVLGKKKRWKSMEAKQLYFLKELHFCLLICHVLSLIASQTDHKEDRQPLILWVDDNHQNNLSERKKATSTYHIQFLLVKSTKAALQYLEDHPELKDASSSDFRIVTDWYRPDEEELAAKSLIESVRANGWKTPVLIYCSEKTKTDSVIQNISHTSSTYSDVMLNFYWESMSLTEADLKAKRTNEKKTTAKKTKAAQKKNQNKETNKEDQKEDDSEVEPMTSSKSAVYESPPKHQQKIAKSISSPVKTESMAKAETEYEPTLVLKDDEEEKLAVKEEDDVVPETLPNNDELENMISRKKTEPSISEKKPTSHDILLSRIPTLIADDEEDETNGESKSSSKLSAKSKSTASKKKSSFLEDEEEEYVDDGHVEDEEEFVPEDEDQKPIAKSKSSSSNKSTSSKSSSSKKSLSRQPTEEIQITKKKTDWTALLSSRVPTNVNTPPPSKPKSIFADDDDEEEMDVDNHSSTAAEGKTGNTSSLKSPPKTSSLKKAPKKTTSTTKSKVDPLDMEVDNEDGETEPTPVSSPIKQPSKLVAPIATIKNLHPLDDIEDDDNSNDRNDDDDDDDEPLFTSFEKKNTNSISPSKSILIGSIEELEIGHLATFVVESRDKNGEKITVGGAKISALFKGESHEFDGFVTDNQNGMYSIICLPTRIGEYQLILTANAVAISGSPFAVSVIATPQITKKRSLIVESDSEEEEDSYMKANPKKIKTTDDDEYELEPTLPM